MTQDRCKPSLNRGAEQPLYLQLYERLRLKIQRGEWPAGSMIPTETEVMSGYDVSRITARAALDQLVRDGLIDRRRGKGSFVIAQVPEVRACLTSLTEEVMRSGRTPTTDVVGVVRQLTDRLADDTQLPFEPGEALARIERVRMIDGQRVALMRSFVPERLVPGIAESDFSESGPSQSLLYVLENKFGVVLSQGEETLLPQLATSRDAKLLGINPGDPVAVKICRIEDVAGVTTLYETAVWCAPQTQPIHRVPDSVSLLDVG
mgnify:CR=1 FL=1